MTVEGFARLGEFGILCLPSPNKDISGAYIGDLLSWVMGKAESGNAWITIMSNVNIVAVAALTDVSCILLAEGVVPDDEVLNVARDKGINILSTDLPAYDAALKTSSLI